MRSTVILALVMLASGFAHTAEKNQLTGKVLETLDVPSYTYVRLETAVGDEVWAAIPTTSLEVGTQIVIRHSTTMTMFESKALGRTFDEIYFGALEDDRPAPIEVAKAEGANGRTIAELYAGKGDLSGKTVALRGQVVKYNSGIMGKNWLHLQDGTGDADTGSNDIVVTSLDTAVVGDTVLVEGTVAVDKDFGAGYLFAVIVEDASLK